MLLAEDSLTEEWNARYRELDAFHERWGHANAPLGNPLGKWVALQRRLRAEGKLDPSAKKKLNSFPGFSWESPTEKSWDRFDAGTMISRLQTYISEHGNAQVPKKYVVDPDLGAWVAAVRRANEVLPAPLKKELDDAGFEWVSSRKCGSAFMDSFRMYALRMQECGGPDAGEATLSKKLSEGGREDAELLKWAEAQRRCREKGKLSQKRIEYLDGIGFSWERTP